MNPRAGSLLQRRGWLALASAAAWFCLAWNTLHTMLDIPMLVRVDAALWRRQAQPCPSAP